MNALRRRVQLDRLATIAWVSLLVLTLGAAGHLWHHLTDPDCENPLRGSGHACAACAGFHGGVVAGHSDVAAAPPPTAPSRLNLSATDSESTQASPVGPTRGPPTA